jgi:hypothetical protein
MDPYAFTYKQDFQPSANPSYPQSGLSASGVAAFRPQTAAAQSGMNPSATNPYAASATPATTNPYQGGYTNSNQLGTVTGRQNVVNYQGEGGQMDPLINLLKSLGIYNFPLAGQQASFGANLEGQREGAIQNYMNYASPASQQAQVNTFGNEARQNANVTAQGANSLQKAAGLGTGYQAGNAQAANQAAANATNQYQQQIQSPQYQQQLLQGLLGAISQGQSSPALQQLLQMNPQLMQQEQTTLQNSQQGGLWQGLAGIGGALAGGGAFNKLIQGGGGGQKDGSVLGSGYW